MKNFKSIAMAALILVMITGTVFADYTISWPSTDGNKKLIPASSSGVKCDGELTASKYLVNTGESVSIKLTPGPSPPDFIGRAVQHNASATYRYQGISGYLIRVDGKEYASDAADYSFSAPGDYEVRGYITFQWRTNKSNAGFPKYYFKKRIMTKVIRVSDLDDAVSPAQPDGKEEGEVGKQEDIVPTLSGMVSHTDDWENNRKQFNAYCRESGNFRWERDDDVYWSGEKFMLAAIATGKQQPSSVHVKIEGNPYETNLVRREGSWTGELFDRSMIDRWGRDGPERLNFIFSAVIDGRYCEDIQQVIVDDLHKYWLMHRKE